LASRRLGGHQTCESVVLHTWRYRHHYRQLVVHALDPCDGPAPFLTCRARRCLSRRSSVRRSWMRLLGRPRAAMRLLVTGRRCGCVSPACSCRVRRRVRVMVLLLSRHFVIDTVVGQRLSVRRSLMAFQVCRQPPPPTTHARRLSTSCRRSHPRTLTSVSCRRCLTRSRSMWVSRAVVDAVPHAVDGPSRRLRPRCDSLPCPRSM
jgi:hypothetical protein